MKLNPIIPAAILFAAILSASINPNNGNATTEKIQGLYVYVFDLHTSKWEAIKYE